MELHRRSVLAGLAAAAFCPICLARAAAVEEYDPRDAAADWGYGDGPTGPAYWGNLSPAYYSCGAGRQQSPIALSNATPRKLPPLRIGWQTHASTVENNGHTILVKVPAVARSTIAEGGCEDFTLEQFHFHQKSEHSIGDTRYAMEIHFVHANATSAALTVLGVFIQPGGPKNPELQRIWDHVPPSGRAPSAAFQVNPRLLLPQSFAGPRFRYAGSLTTPGCAQIVNWQVLPEPIKIDQRQIDQFTGWYADNARPALPRGTRVLQFG